jgi:hypothetical protein
MAGETDAGTDRQKERGEEIEVQTRSLPSRKRKRMESDVDRHPQLRVLHKILIHNYIF